MAEGGIAAALANVDDRDNWKVHFADTMRGGQYVNNWRMAELHAKEAPDRVRELEAWGAVFDRTKDGRILQRNFGGHKYPRLAHVGDRTGSGNDSHVAGSRRASRHRGLHGDLHRRVVERWRALSSAPSGTIASAAGSRFFAPKQSFSPPAELARPTRLRATVGIAPATGIHSRIMPARR